MNAEEIIERLLDERKISAKEAIILVKGILGIVKEDLKNKVKRKINIPNPSDPDRWGKLDIVQMYGVMTPMTVMYGVMTYPSTGWDNINSSNDTNYSTDYQSSSITTTCCDNDQLKG